MLSISGWRYKLTSRTFFYATSRSRKKKNSIFMITIDFVTVLVHAWLHVMQVSDLWMLRFKLLFTNKILGHKNVLLYDCHTRLVKHKHSNYNCKSWPTLVLRKYVITELRYQAGPHGHFSLHYAGKGKGKDTRLYPRDFTPYICRKRFTLPFAVTPYPYPLPLPLL